MSILTTAGTYTVVYPSADINREVVGYTPNEIKSQLAEVYQELANASVNVSATNEVTFTLPSGQKN